jgi:bidirectional [NiFe] hydrogenase diaphorase subunit
MTKKNDHPSGDERFKAIDLTMKQFRHEKDALLEVLNTAQETFGYLSEDLLIYISSHLNVPMSQIYGVATFYQLFTFEPLGEHNCVVCTGTACHVKGSAIIVERLAMDLNIEQGGTTADGLMSLTTARCLGSCGLAPVIVLDGQVMGKETPETSSESVLEILAQSTQTEHQEVEAG